MKILTQTLTAIALAGALVSTGQAPAHAHDAAEARQIDLIYVWTARPGMEDQLIATYQAVGSVLEANEPGLLTYEISVSETGHQLVIREVFADSEALALHLTGTAAQYFPQIAQIATPGPFIFRGDVPDDLKAAAYGMEMGAIFTGDWTGFERD